MNVTDSGVRLSITTSIIFTFARWISVGGLRVVLRFDSR